MILSSHARHTGLTAAAGCNARSAYQSQGQPYGNQCHHDIECRHPVRDQRFQRGLLALEVIHLVRVPFAVCRVTQCQWEAQNFIQRNAPIGQ